MNENLEMADGEMRVHYLDLFDTSSSSSSSSTSSDEFTDLNPKKKCVRTRENCFSKYDDEEFERRFRLPKFMVMELTSKLEADLNFLDNRNKPISARDQLLIALRYFATGNFQIVTADLFGVSQSSICRIVLRVSKAIAKLATEVIKFPQSEFELQKMKEEVYQIAGIPHTIGIIDGKYSNYTDIYFTSEYSLKEHIFQFNHLVEEMLSNSGIEKVFFSINCQVVCDANMKILDLTAR